jgi:hypothetical protein
MCWIKKLVGALQVADTTDILVTRKIKYRQFTLCLHLTAINWHWYLTYSMWITSKESPVFKKRIGQRKKHGTRVVEVCFLISIVYYSFVVR